MVGVDFTTWDSYQQNYPNPDSGLEKVPGPGDPDPKKCKSKRGKGWGKRRNKEVKGSDMREEKANK